MASGAGRHSPVPGVMYSVVFSDALPLKYASDVKRKISTAPGTSGMPAAGLPDAAATALAAADAAVAPTPRCTVTLPELMMRNYPRGWAPPDTRACTPVGALDAAVMATVGPWGLKGIWELVAMIKPFQECGCLESRLKSH